MSAEGTIVGEICATSVNFCVPAMWTSATAAPQILPTRGRTFGGAVTSINKYGVMAGVGRQSGQPTRAWEWRAGRLNDLGIGAAEGINASNQIVGTLSNPYPQQAVFYLGLDRYSDVTPAGQNSTAIALNDHGAVIGTIKGSGKNGNNLFVPYVYQGGKLTKIPIPSDSPYGNAGAISESGDADGNYLTSNPNDYPHGFMYRNGTFTDLNSLLPSGSGWEIISAADFDFNGDFIGMGRNNGQTRGILMHLTN